MSAEHEQATTSKPQQWLELNEDLIAGFERARGRIPVVPFQQREEVRRHANSGEPFFLNTGERQVIVLPLPDYWHIAGAAALHPRSEIDILPSLQYIYALRQMLAAGEARLAPRTGYVDRPSSVIGYTDGDQALLPTRASLEAVRAFQRRRRQPHITAGTHIIGQGLLELGIVLPVGEASRSTSIRTIRGSQRTLWVIPLRQLQTPR